MKDAFASHQRPVSSRDGVSRIAIILTDGKEDEQPPKVAQVGMEKQETSPMNVDHCDDESI